jgi:hypothetical protein
MGMEAGSVMGLITGRAPMPGCDRMNKDIFQCLKPIAFSIEMKPVIDLGSHPPIEAKAISVFEIDR